MDYGKEKFGGPFTEEEVEDVKTVLRLIPLVICLSLCNSIAYSDTCSIRVFNFELNFWLIPVMLIPLLVCLCFRNHVTNMLRCRCSSSQGKNTQKNTSNMNAFSCTHNIIQRICHDNRTVTARQWQAVIVTVIIVQWQAGKCQWYRHGYQDSRKLCPSCQFALLVAQQCPPIVNIFCGTWIAMNLPSHLQKPILLWLGNKWALDWGQLWDYQ